MGKASISDEIRGPCGYFPYGVQKAGCLSKCLNSGLKLGCCFCSLNEIFAHATIMRRLLG